jgi:transcriptional antiterminator NusG
MIYVLHVMTGKEIAVRDELRRVPYAAMVPREICLERRDGEIAKRERVLFAGYVFIDMSMNLQSYYKIRDIPHVIKFLGGGSPLQLSTAEAKHIEWLNNGGKPLEPSELDEDGIVKTGPLKGRDLDVVAMNKRAKRAKLLITLAGIPQEISLSVTTAVDSGGGTDGDKTVPSE